MAFEYFGHCFQKIIDEFCTIICATFSLLLVTVHCSSLITQFTSSYPKDHLRFHLYSLINYTSIVPIISFFLHIKTHRVHRQKQFKIIQESRSHESSPKEPPLSRPQLSARNPSEEQSNHEEVFTSKEPMKNNPGYSSDTLKRLCLVTRQFVSLGPVAEIGKKVLGHVRLSLSLSAAVTRWLDPKKRHGRAGNNDVKARTRLLATGTRDFAKLFDPRLYRRAFIPTRAATPPFASLDQHPATRFRAHHWLDRDHVQPRWGGSVTRGFYGNGLSVARDNVVIGIHRGATERARPAARARGRIRDGRGKGCEINVRRLVYRQQSHAKSRGAHPREHCLFMSLSLSGRFYLALLGYDVSPYRFYLFKSFPLSLHFFRNTRLLPNLTARPLRLDALLPPVDDRRMFRLPQFARYWKRLLPKSVATVQDITLRFIYRLEYLSIQFSRTPPICVIVPLGLSIIVSGGYCIAIISLFFLQFSSYTYTLIFYILRSKFNNESKKPSKFVYRSFRTLRHIITQSEG